MSSTIEDLVRETLAERAHDVDGLALAPAPAPHRTRRWVAIGTVVTIAAAILVAVVLVAPWKTEHRTTTATVPTPPAGMQWVSYHGITLTVPADARVSSACDLSIPTCTVDIAGSSEWPLNVSLATEEPGSLTGTPTTIDGHFARVLDLHTEKAPPDYTRIVTLTDVGVVVTISSGPGTGDVVSSVVDGIRFTPVDHYGCTEAPPRDVFVPKTVAVRSGFDGVSAIAMCEYSTTDYGLLGSRLLTTPQVAGLEELFARADPDLGVNLSRGVGPGIGLRVFRTWHTDGQVSEFYADNSSGAVLFANGNQRGVAPGDLPTVY